jgi:hypothetical protein
MQPILLTAGAPLGTAREALRSQHMPRYHFDLIGKQTVVDYNGLDLTDDVMASDTADRLANELYSSRPEFRHQHYSVLVTDEDGEEVCRSPIWNPVRD